MLFKFNLICTLLNLCVIIFVLYDINFPKDSNEMEEIKEDKCLKYLILIKLYRDCLKLNNTPSNPEVKKIN